MRRVKNKYSRGRHGFFRRHRRIMLLASLSVVGLFILVNAVLAVIFSSRTYPGTKVMDASIGSVAYGSLSDKVSDLELLPKEVTFTKDKQTIKVPLAELGITKDVERAVASAKEQRAWLPIANLFMSPQLKAPIAIDAGKLDAKSAELAQVIKTDAVAAHILIEGSKVSIVKEKGGYNLDTPQLKDSLIGAFDDGKTTLTPPVKAVKAQTVAADLASEKTSLEAQIATSVAFKYEGKSRQASSTDIAGWYSPSGATYAFAADKLTAYLAGVGTEFGIRIKDVSGVVSTVASNLKAKKSATITLTAQTAAKTYNYCTGARGVDASSLTALRNKLKSTYADSRGWSLGGLVEFKEVSSGCDFTVWLSASSQMTSFGGVCDPVWSCRSGDNVVLNYDRWTGASDAWNQYGGSLEDYRSMLINHETGHRLGFGHRYCGGAGQLAPVMQQQSIDLQGCKFNPWPISIELDALRTALGL